MSAVPIPMLRTSERKAFKRCIQRWWWAYREGLKPKHTPFGPLWFGTGVHIALAEWYIGPGTKRGVHPAETWAKFSEGALASVKVENATEEQVAKYEDAGKLGTVLMDEYVKLYGRDEHKLYISPEKTFGLLIPWPNTELGEEGSDLRSHLVDYRGTFDGVWRHADTGKLWLDETKTAATISTGHLSLDDQGGAYWAVAGRTLKEEGLIGQKDKLAGIEYNFIRKALPDDRPKDAEGYATNQPTKVHYVDAINAALKAQPWSGPAAGLTGKEKVSELVDIANKLELVVVGERSKVQPKPLFERVPIHRTARERATQLRRIQEEALHMEAVRSSLLPITKTPDISCRYQCDFFDMCELHEAGGDGAIGEYKSRQFRVEDPYSAHQTAKSTEE